MVLSDVEETITSVEIDEETYEEVYKVGCLWTICVACAMTAGTVDGSP